MEKIHSIKDQAMKQRLNVPDVEESSLQLTGSQINLTSRSQRSILKSPKSPDFQWKSRPYSAFPCCDKYIENKSHWKRPMSADNGISQFKISKNSSKNYSIDFLGCSVEEGGPLVPDPNFKHCYTYMSSNLLRSLIRNPWDSDCSEVLSNSSEHTTSERSLGCLIREMAQENSSQENGNYFKSSSKSPRGSTENIDDFRLCQEKINKLNPPKCEELRKSNQISSEAKDIKFQKWLPQSSSDEKMVEFSQEQKELSKSPVQEVIPQLEYNPEQFTSPESPFMRENEISVLVTEAEKIENPKNDYSNADTDVFHCRQPSLDSHESKSENRRSCSDDCPFSCCKDSGNKKSFRSAKIELETTKNNTDNERIEVETSEEKVSDIGSTYGEIVTIINVLEQEETNSLLLREVEPHREAEEEPLTTGKNNEQLQDIYSYLDEVEKSSLETITVAKNHLETVRTGPQSVLSAVSSVPRLEDLLNKGTVELAHEVLTLKLQIEDQSSGIKLLQTTINEMRDEARLIKTSHEQELMNIKNDAEMAVQRHQKFIKQLLQEKKGLNDKVEKLVEDLKAGEERYQRNLKTIEERHAIEIQRVKEAQAVAEKLKREKWIDIKTQKIKEMTVKGLEPELSRMAARQQQEIADLRNLHRSELEAVELRATRRTTELLEQLRTELLKDKEEAILRETNALRAKLEKQFEEEQSKLEHEMRKLREEKRREKEILENKETQLQDTYQEMRRALEREKERERQHLVQEFQEQFETLKRRHQNEMKSVRDTLEIEKEAWMNNYKKQQSAKFLEREAELHHQYKRERDKDIELVIERLENEASLAQQEMTQAAENKFKRMKEKFEQDFHEMEATEATLKTKLSDAKMQLLEKDDEIAELKSKIHHSQSDMCHLKKLCEEMSKERSNLKEIIAKEFEEQIAQMEKDKEELKNQMAAVKTSHIIELAKRDQLAVQAKAEAQQELNQVYNRVKITISKKEEALNILREQHKTVLERCSHLEKLLENQRKNLLLK